MQGRGNSYGKRTPPFSLITTIFPFRKSHLLISLSFSLLSFTGENHNLSSIIFWDLFAEEMTAPNMAAITASLERSLQNCSLNHQTRSGTGSGLGIGGSSSSSDETPDNHLPNSDTTLELNSHMSLPYHWEQCLDLKTGEIYYINWRTGMKAKEDPRITAEYSGDFYSEDESSYDSEESSSESSPSSRERYRVDQKDHKDHVLVVAGCKSCLMYVMVPKQAEDCPKCSGQLLHFDKCENGSP